VDCNLLPDLLDLSANHIQLVIDQFLVVIKLAVSRKKQGKETRKRNKENKRAYALRHLVVFGLLNVRLGDIPIAAHNLLVKLFHFLQNYFRTTKTKNNTTHSFVFDDVGPEYLECECVEVILLLVPQRDRLQLLGQPLLLLDHFRDKLLRQCFCK
jgi:hypothetical protein